MLVELDRLLVLLLRVAEEFTLNVLAGSDPEDGPGGDAFVYVQGHRIDGEAGRCDSRLPAHSSHGSWVRRASANRRASSGVSGRRVASASRSGSWSASPFVSNRRTGGRRGL